MRCIHVVLALGVEVLDRPAVLIVGGLPGEQAVEVGGESRRGELFRAPGRERDAVSHGQVINSTDWSTPSRKFNLFLSGDKRRIWLQVSHVDPAWKPAAKTDGL